MKKLYYLLILVLLYSCTQKSPSKLIKIDLSGYWNFKTGDSPAWADPKYNDTSWKSIWAAYNWASQGYPKNDGFAWYRTTIVLPSAMKKQAYHDSIVFDFGKIYDCSQIYIDGKLIETSPNFYIKGGTDYNLYHKLILNTSQLKWDKKICIAVRVFNKDGNGGFSNPYLSIRPLFFDFIKVVDIKSNNENLVLNKPAEIYLTINNLKKEKTNAVLDYFIINSNSNTVTKLESILTLKNGKHDYQFSFTPSVPGFYYVTYCLSYTNLEKTVIQGRGYAGITDVKPKLQAFANNKIPLIYSSDLFHPHDDPDDHFDLASLFSINNFDIRGVILDEGMTKDQKKRNGIIPVAQLKYLTKLKFPVYMGLTEKIKNPEDAALYQPFEYQQGVNMILETLEKSPIPVTLISVGSTKDFAAAYNRNPDLFKKKAAKLVLFIGDANDLEPKPYEWNVKLDSCAYICLMNSGLPIYWIPCWDRRSAGTNASEWIGTHLLKYSSQKLINYFNYMLLIKDDADIIGYMESNNDTCINQSKELWGAGVFTYFAGMQIVKKENDYIALDKNQIQKNDTIVYPFTFEPVSVVADEKGVVHKENSKKSHKIMLFKINDNKLYPKIMTSVTANLLKILDK